MGGLQRSGTTWLEGLVSSPRVSGLSFDNVDLAAYQERQPWLLQNHSQEYFELVVRSGGVEGKFVQDAYPYVYTVRDVGKQGHNLSSLLLDARSATAQSAERLYDEWSLFWDTSKSMLLEKTPENLLMGPYLQAAFGASASRFAFVMRHPLVWALAIEKWIFPDFQALRTVEDRIAFWFDTMSRAVEHLPQLRDVLLVQLETASSSTDLQLGVAGHLLCSMSGGDSRASGNDVSELLAPEVDGESTDILSSSMAYVSCWLAGMEFKSSARRCVPRKSFRDPAFRQQPELLAMDNRYRLRQIARQRETQANQFGYTFRPFLALARKPTSMMLRERVMAGTPTSMATQIGVVPTVSTLRPALRPFLAVVPPKSTSMAAMPVPPGAAHASTRQGVILVYHKMGFDRDRPSGMDLRMTQIVNSLVSLQYTVHFVCHCDVHESQLSPFADPHVVIYDGSLQEQFSKALSAGSPLRSVLIFFTTLTMSVHQRMIQGDADWYTEPTAPLPEEQVLSWVRARSDLQTCTVAVADDIHYLRAVEVMARHDAAKAQRASEWIRRRELGFHSAVDGTATVSLEDAETLNRALADHAPTLIPGTRCMSGCACTMTWVPYVQATRSEGSVEPFGRRHEGMLYVGGMHGLAVIAIEWLLGSVQPLIGSTSSRGEVELLRGGKGHLHLAGPGWAQHAVESRVLNQSVAAGRVTILGTLSDLQLDQRLQDHKVFVAPVLNGTGIATKNVLAMAHGIPLVTTFVGLNGLGLPLDQRAILVADSPSGFASHVVNVQSSERVFNVTWRAAIEHTRTYLSADRQRVQLCRMIGCTAAAPLPPQERLSSKLCNTNASPRWELHRASHAWQALLNRTGIPVVVIGTAGTNVSALATALRTPRVCLVTVPLQSLQRAPIQAQADHLDSLLSDSYYCQASLADPRVESPHPLIQGFAIELGASEQLSSSMLSSVAGLQKLVQMLGGAKVVVLRRCSVLDLAVERLTPQSAHCATGESCGALAHRRAALNAAELVQEIDASTQQDLALQILLNAIGAEYLTLDVDSRGAHAGATGQLSQLKAFLRLPHSHPVISNSSRGTDDVLSTVENANDLRAHLVAVGRGPALDGCVRKPLSSAVSMDGAAALAALARQSHRRRPLLVVGTHGVEGGAALVGKVVAEACKGHLTHDLGWRCVMRDEFESCDAEADVCFHKQAHFSAGRFVDRGYRFVHVTRSPLDMLARSYQLLEPNATRSMNSSVLLVALEAHWKKLSNGLLHSMQDISESHAADPHSLDVKLEDLMPDAHANATLARIFAFLLDAEVSDARVQSIVAAVAKGLTVVGRAEVQGDTQRKHMSKLLVRKPAKCLHVSRVQQAVGYAALPCPESAKATSSSTSTLIGNREDPDREPPRHRTERTLRLRRRLMEVARPRTRRWRLAAAWV